MTPEMVRRMKATHPRLDVVEVMDAGHCPHLMTEEQTDIVEAWLASHASHLQSNPSFTVETSAS
ncbi:alpha/beta fold hydrolase [Ralstonia syzygii subsp. celebesensis]|uniref:alpha/beta fold hydrolase n=1 Tax=Ralstonia syzygii TaxID=28097 RepID=UPI00387E1497